MAARPIQKTLTLAASPIQLANFSALLRCRLHQNKTFNFTNLHSSTLNRKMAAIEHPTIKGKKPPRNTAWSLMARLNTY
jgi:hypothetical protein